MEHERCLHGENLVPMEPSYCKIFMTCGRFSPGTLFRFIGTSKCKPCSTVDSDQELICGDNGITYT
jgi:hypothetical protein